MPSAKTKLKVSDIDKVSKKLDVFMEKLPAQEQEVLGWILARAQAAGDATEAVKSISPAKVGTAAARPAVSSTLARAAGLNQAAGSEIGVTWKHSFGKVALDRSTPVTKVATKAVRKTIR